MTDQEVVERILGFPADEVDDGDLEPFYELVDLAEAMEDPVLALPAFFRLLEKHPQVQFGNPGPIASFLEESSGYEAELLRSTRRCPTPATVWMLNAVANEDEGHREPMLAELERIAAEALGRCSEFARLAADELRAVFG